MEKLEFPRVGEQMYHAGAGQRAAYLCGAQARLSEELRLFCHQLRRHGYEVQAGRPVAWTLRRGWPTILEHKMFDTKEGNALQELAANGASPNAFTSNAITGYYFESTEKFEENLRILLSFVSIP